MDYFYIFLWGTIFLLSILHFYGFIKYKDGLMNAFILIWAFFVGFRKEIGLDWYNYVSFFNNGITNDTESGSYEIIFSLFRNLIYALGFRYEIFLFLLSFFSLFLIKYSAKTLEIKNIYMVFLCYISMFFCFYQFNIVRSGIMASCVWMALAQKIKEKNLLAIIWCLIGAGFHLVALAFIPIVLLSTKKYSLQFIVVFMSVGYLVMVFGIGNYILGWFPILNSIDRLAGYLDPANRTEKGVTLGAVFNLVLFVYLFFSEKNEYDSNVKFRTIINILFWGLFVTSFFNYIGMVSTRVGQVLNVSLVFIWPYFISLVKDKSNKSVVLLIFIVYLLMYYIRALRPDDLLGYSSIYPFKFQYQGIFRQY